MQKDQNALPIPFPSFLTRPSSWFSNIGRLGFRSSLSRRATSGGASEVHGQPLAGAGEARGKPLAARVEAPEPNKGHAVALWTFVYVRTGTSWRDDSPAARLLLRSLFPYTFSGVGVVPSLGRVVLLGGVLSSIQLGTRSMPWIWDSVRMGRISVIR
jgi:hypothetical protein